MQKIFISGISQTYFQKEKINSGEVFYINGSDTLPPPLTKEEEAEALSLLEKKVLKPEKR